MNFPTTKSPDIYFETRSSKHTSSDRLAKGGLMNMDCEEKYWETTSICRMEVGQSGMYCAWNLREKNHCQKPRSQRASLSKFARENYNVELSHISSEANHVDVGNLVILQHDSMEMKTLRPSIDELDLKDVFKSVLLKFMCDDFNKRRNASQISGGWLYQSHDFDEEARVSAPTCGGDMDNWLARKMVMMSTLIQKMVALVPGMEEPYKHPAMRRQHFASQIPKKYGVEGTNIIESLTLSLTTLDEGKKSKSVLFSNHRDENNCGKWPEVFVCWNHFRCPSTKRWFRVSVIAYSRSIVSAYYDRIHARDFIFNNVVAYFNGLPEKRTQLMGAEDICGSEFERQVPVNMNKSCFYGCYVTGIRRLVQKFCLTLEQTVELILPCAWATSGSKLYRLHSKWLKEGLPQNHNLAVASLDVLFKHFHGIIGPGSNGQRFQPFFNKPIEACVVELNTNKLANILRNLGMQQQADSGMYKRAQEQLAKEIYGVKTFGAMHILALSGLCNVIPLFYATEGLIAEGTGTFRSLQKQGLRKGVVNHLLKDLQKELGLNGSEAENLMCEYFRDMGEYAAVPYSSENYAKGVEKRGLKWPDTFFNDQSIFYVCNDELVELICDGSQSSAPILAYERNTQKHKPLYSNSSRLLQVTTGSIMIPTVPINESSMDFNDNTRKRTSSRAAFHGPSRAPSRKAQKRLYETSDTKEKRTMHHESKARQTSQKTMPTFKQNMPTRYKSLKSNSQRFHVIPQVTLCKTFEELNLGDDKKKAVNLDRRQPANSGYTTNIAPHSVVREVLTTLDTLCEGNCSSLLPNFRDMVNFHSWVNHEGRTLYSASISSCNQIVNTEQDRLVHPDGFAQNHGAKSYYYSKAKAERACVIRILVEVCTETREPHAKTWAERVLPRPTRMPRKAEPLVQHQQLGLVNVYELGKKGNKWSLFGILYFTENSNRALAIPIGNNTKAWVTYDLGY